MKMNIEAQKYCNDIAKNHLINLLGLVNWDVEDESDSIELLEQIKGYYDAFNDQLIENNRAISRYERDNNIRQVEQHIQCRCAIGSQKKENKNGNLLQEILKGLSQTERDINEITEVFYLTWQNWKYFANKAKNVDIDYFRAARGKVEIRGNNWRLKLYVYQGDICMEYTAD